MIKSVVRQSEQAMGLLADSGKTSSPSVSGSGSKPGPEDHATEHRQDLRPELRKVDWHRIINTCAHMAPSLSKVIGNFWGQPVKVNFLSASQETLYFWRMDEFHVSQVSLDTSGQAGGASTDINKILQLRISDLACSAFLSQALGPREVTAAARHNEFRFDRITDFEAHLLSRFSRDVLTCLVKGCIKLEKATKKQSHRKAPLIHLIWSVQLDLQPEVPENQSCGKIVLTLPLEALKLEEEPFADEPVEGQESGLPLSMFDHAHVEAYISVGQAKVRLEELEALEPGDLIMIQDSRIDQMALIDPGSGPPFQSPHKKLYPFTARILNPEKIIDPYAQEIMMMENQQNTAVKQNLWDNLMIDVSAEFFPAKLPLSQLRQMSEGLVVEIADLIHNRVRILVEGKTVAVGELVIVGDKFGVRVTQLDDFGDEPPRIISAPAASTETLPIAAAPQQIAPEAYPSEGEDPYAQSGDGYTQPEYNEYAPQDPAQENDLNQYLDGDFDNDTNDW